MLQKSFNPRYDSKLRIHESKLFLKQWLKNPGRLGTVAPISVKLAREAATMAKLPNNGLVVEIGAGTGRLTRALLKSGISASKLAVVELDAKLSGFLNQTLSKFCEGTCPPQVINGDAADLADMLPRDWIGHVETVVSSIPLMCLSEQKRLQIVEAAFSVLKPGGKLLHLTYNPKSPIAFSTAYTQTRIFELWVNVPPGFVWLYQKKEEGNAYDIEKQSVAF